MNVRLTPQQQEFVKKQVEDGRYLSDSEVVREGLRLLQEETEWRAEVRRKISEGVYQARAGKVLDGAKAIQSVLDSLDA
jgi:antitoxin ParD1/3/4